MKIGLHMVIVIICMALKSGVTLVEKDYALKAYRHLYKISGLERFIFIMKKIF